MDPNRHADLPEETLARVVSVAYGDAGLRARWRVTREARRDPVVRDLLEEHRRVAHEVRRVPALKVPERVVENAWAEIARREPHRVGAPVLSLRVLCATGAALAAALCFLLVLQVPIPSSVQQETYSQAEVEEARRQIETAFALVNRSVAKAGMTLNEEILVPNVARPIRSGATIVEQLFRRENPS